MTKSKVIKALNDLGLTKEGFEDDYHLYKCEGYWRFDAWLPKGKVWNSTDCHSFVVDMHVDGNASEFWGDVMEHINMGITNCELPDCDTCEGY